MKQLNTAAASRLLGVTNLQLWRLMKQIGAQPHVISERNNLWNEADVVRVKKLLALKYKYRRDVAAVCAA